jgi:hypothetical protein
MRYNAACIDFLSSVKIILGNFNGIIDTVELLLPLRKNEVDLVSRATADQQLRDFPTLLDMKLCSYKFVNQDSSLKIFCDIISKTFFIKKLTYYTFNEHFEGWEDE